MKRFLSTMCAAALSVTFAVTSFMPANAAPVYVPKVASGVSGAAIDVQNVQYNRRDRRIERRMDRRFDRRDIRRDYRNDRRGYYRGHRGYRDYRRGYRRHNDGYWYPAAAFIAGAIIGGAINQPAPRPVYRGGNAHVQWCYNRYRSYRASDNTFQPYNGPRQLCRSPY
jgi:hypothetical protein